MNETAPSSVITVAIKAFVATCKETEMKIYVVVEIHCWEEPSTNSAFVNKASAEFHRDYLYTKPMNKTDKGYEAYVDEVELIGEDDKK